MESEFVKGLMKNASNEIRMDKVLQGKISAYYSFVVLVQVCVRDFIAVKYSLV